LPRISIVTPSYKQVAFLEQTIQSVLTQDYPSLEYIIVDGNSGDGSLEVIRKYANRLAWWVSEPDSGQAEAITKGMKHANGEYVAWLNSDDLYLPGSIASAIEALEANPAVGMVFGDAVTIDERGARINRLAFGDWGLEELMGFRIICQPAVFMRRNIFRQAGDLDPTYHYLLDHHLWLRIARLAPIRHVPSTWAAARHHPGAKNVSQASGFGQEAFRILEWMENQPDMDTFVKRHRRRIEAGAYRLNARYLLDGGQPAPALRSYFQALWRSPGFTLKHWRRILYASVVLLGGKPLAESYNRRRMQIH
jgi:glycosyltransferase involved in cell wall biosynthesis